MCVYVHVYVYVCVCAGAYVYAMYHTDATSSNDSNTTVIGGAAVGVVVLIIIVVLCVLIFIKLYKRNNKKKRGIHVTNKVESESDAAIYANKNYDDVNNTVNDINLQTLNTPSTASFMVNNAISDLERTITQSSEGELKLSNYIIVKCIDCEDTVESYEWKIITRLLIHVYTPVK